MMASPSSTEVPSSFPIVMFLMLCIFPVAIALLFGSDLSVLTTETLIGVDLGTTFSTVAVCRGGEARVIPVMAGASSGHAAAMSRSPDTSRTTGLASGPDRLVNVTPSVVTYLRKPSARATSTGLQAYTTLVGAEARSRRDEGSYVYATKRLIGRPFEHDAVQTEKQQLGYDVVAADDGATTQISLDGGKLVVTPEDVGGAVLAQLVTAAEQSLGWLNSALGFRFKALTVSVPVGFDVDQRRATINAARKYVPNVRQVRLLEEPIAAALAFGLHEEYRQAGSGASATKNLVVFDFGGGTLDVALIDFDANNDGFVVVGAGGDNRLGGEDFDRAIAQLLVQKCGGGDESGGVDVQLAAETAKRELGLSEEVFVNVPCHTSLTRHDVDAAVAPLVKRMVGAVSHLLEEHFTSTSSIDDVVLVGGSSRMYLVEPALRKFFSNSTRIRSDVDGETAIALGAARSFGCSAGGR